jgi:hypothetical protein
MWSFPWSFRDSHKSTKSLEFNVSIVSMNLELECLYLAENLGYKNQPIIFN